LVNWTQLILISVFDKLKFVVICEEKIKNII